MTAEAHAIGFLAAEVPKWKRDNGCYSCHNNGDAARALCAARAAGLLPDRRPLDDTLAFLAAPERWDANGPDGPFKDRQLARIQFAAALAAAHRAGLPADAQSLERAAPLVTELQQPDGGWPADPATAVGSPVTYGRGLATALALRTLSAAEAPALRESLDKGLHWCERYEAQSVLDAAAMLWALADRKTDAAQTQRGRCLERIVAGQSPDGGWGPFVNSPPEVFDTAVVVLALAAQPKSFASSKLLDAGRGYLIAAQLKDGSWPATTRPHGADSYAQQMSTTAWATLALLATRPAPAADR